MRGNTFGKIFSITTFGESHGDALGVIIDGMPSNLEINLEDLKIELSRRAPGKHKTSTSRQELDAPIILSGIFENRTLGTPICVIVHNTNQKSSDYDHLKNQNRPGHADQTTIQKFGIRDHRGGGRSSGRETLARVIGGYFASLIIPQIKVGCYIERIGHYQIKEHPTPNWLLQHSPLPPVQIHDAQLKEEVEQYLLDCKKNGESVGGTVIVTVRGTPAGLGEPVFDKLKADLAKAMLSIGSCTGFVYGRGEEFASLRGTEISSDRSNFGGIEGGISNGEDINFKLFFKAPSTVEQNALSGRHDPCIIPRVIPVVEAMLKITLADHYLRQNAYCKI